VSRRLFPALALAAALTVPGGAVAAPVKAPPAAAEPGPPPATVKIKPLGLDGGKARILSTVRVAGTLSPYAPNQKVAVTFYLDGKPVKRARVKVGKGEGGAGSFDARIKVKEAGKYAVSARHAPTALLGGDSTVRKSWRVSFPSLRQGKCGPVVVAFKKAMRKMGYIANDGSCFGDKTARGVLAYRKVNEMARSMRAGKGLVKRVFAGRGGYRVRHPGAGRHVEAPLSKQVLVFAKDDKPYAIYPISSGKSSTPTVTGHFRFIRTEPGYNSHGMYYSFYFYGGYAVHGYESVPDYPASHGCIRTFIADQPEIYNRIEFGESIFIW
jgi:L,D-transpeptidase catalytic domain